MIDRDKAQLEKRVAKRFQGSAQERLREIAIQGTPEVSSMTEAGPISEGD
jgi:hypothetical protein